MSSPYASTGIAAAELAGLTAAEVRAMGYADIANLAGVKIERNGNSPKDFFWKAVCNQVANAIEETERAADAVTRIAEFKAILRANSLSDDDVSVDREGNMVIGKVR